MTDVDREGLRGPVLPGAGASDYERYLRTDELLSLQKPAQERNHHDELLFTVVHQTSELWLKLASTEVEEAAQRIEHAEVAPALRLLPRATTALAYITDQLGMLGQMSPWDYHEVRVMLGHGSGFDSPGFRRVAAVTQRIAKAFDDLLARRGLELTEVYRASHEHADLYALAELLTDWDESVSIWRARHYRAVARALGEDTMGIQGVPVQALTKLVTQRQLPAAVGGPQPPGGDLRRRARRRAALDVSTGLDIARSPLGNTGLSMPRIALGCGNFGGIGSVPELFGQGLDRDGAFAVMDAAWEAGIDHFDTADAYGGGASEVMVGEWMASRGVRPMLTTKTFNPMDAGADRGLAPERLTRQLQSSLQRLGVDSVDLYLCHEFDPFVALGDSFAVLQDAVQGGTDRRLRGEQLLRRAAHRGAGGGRAGGGAELVLAAGPRRRAHRGRAV